MGVLTLSGQGEAVSAVVFGVSEAFRRSRRMSPVPCSPSTRWQQHWPWEDPKLRG
jgi:hypothetical protein